MKKQYNLTRLTDELQHSVFFQEPKKTKELKKNNQSTLAPKHQVTKVLSNDSAKAIKQQSNLISKHQNTKELKNQSTQAPSNQRAQETKQQVIKTLKHFSSYLEPGTYKAWKLLATQREKRDYEILQEAVEQYLAREQEREMKRR